jgi:hypothetical protein
MQKSFPLDSPVCNEMVAAIAGATGLITRASRNQVKVDDVFRAGHNLWLVVNEDYASHTPAQ